VNPKQVLLNSFLDELEKIAEEKSLFDRIALAGPAIGGVAGGIYGAMKGKKNPWAAAAGGAATGATVGWIPGIMRDFKSAVTPNSG